MNLAEGGDTTPPTGPRDSGSSSPDPDPVILEWEDAYIHKSGLVEAKPGMDISANIGKPPKASEVESSPAPLPPEEADGLFAAARWVSDLIRWFTREWKRAADAVQDFDDYDTYGPVELPPQVRDDAIKLLPHAADLLTQLGRLLSWHSPSDSVILVRKLRETADQTEDDDYTAMDIKGLRRLRRALDTAMAGTDTGRTTSATDGPVGDATQGKTGISESSDKVHPATLAKAILFEEPGISPTDLAKKVGVSRGTLYSNNKKWVDVARTLRARRNERSEFPRGTKSGDGDIEAEAPPDNVEE